METCRCLETAHLLRNGQVRHAVLCQMSSGLGRGSKDLDPYGSGECPAGHISIQKPRGTCRQSRRGLIPESSRELVGCKKPSMEAGMCKQQPGCLVMGSVGSRSLSRIAISPENPPKIGVLLAKKRQLAPEAELPSPCLGAGQRTKMNAMYQ